MSRSKRFRASFKFSTDDSVSTVAMVFLLAIDLVGDPGPPGPVWTFFFFQPAPESLFTSAVVICSNSPCVSSRREYSAGYSDKLAAFTDACRST